MKRSAAILLQTAIALLGIAVFVFLLWEPHVEGRNTHATLFEIYFKDTFLACAYVASTPFFVAAYQAFRLLGDAGRSGAFSLRSLRTLRIIRYCAMIIIGCVAVAEACLFAGMTGEEDIAGGVAMGIFVAVASTAIVAAAALFERTLRARILT